MKQDLVKLEARNDGVYMTLPEGKECPSLPILLQFLENNGILKYNDKSVESFVRLKGKETTKIAERNPEYEKDADINVSISKDNMEACINISPPFFEKPWPTIEQILSLLSEKNVAYGIDNNTIADMIEDHICNHSVIVAKGLHPVTGKDGWMEIKIDLASSSDKTDETERIDYRERGLIVNVSKDDVIAIQFPPTDGTDGMNVLNVPIKANPGKHAPFPNGNGTVLSEDGTTLLAETDGCLKRIDGKFTVSPELNVAGDVDFHVGNIDFIGAVKIRGAVKDGFQVVAGGDIEILEVVEGANVNSKGDILIKGGIRGMNKATISAAGKVEVNFVDQAVINAGTDIIVRDTILHSDISAGGSVFVTGGGKSQIAGGKTQATIEVSCSTLGSEMGTKTEVIVGFSPTHTLRRKELAASLLTYQENIEKIDANLSFLKKLESEHSLDDSKRALMISITKTKFQLQSQMKNAANEIEKIDQMIEITRSQGIVRVKNICYAGVSITIRGFTYLVREPFKFCSFVYDAGEIKLRSYDYR